MSNPSYAKEIETQTQTESLLLSQPLLLSNFPKTNNNYKNYKTYISSISDNNNHLLAKRSARTYQYHKNINTNNTPLRESLQFTAVLDKILHRTAKLGLNRQGNVLLEAEGDLALAKTKSKEIQTNKRTTTTAISRLQPHEIEWDKFDAIQLGLILSMMEPKLKGRR